MERCRLAHVKKQVNRFVLRPLPTALSKTRHFDADAPFVAHYVSGILNGDRAAMGRAISVIESDLPSDKVLAEHMLDGVLPRTGKSRRIGITGVPGSGKSSFIDALGMHLLHELGEKGRGAERRSFQSCLRRQHPR